MKTWMKVILTSLLLMIVCPLTAPAATGAAGNLTANGSNVNVSLKLPEGETEGITSLRMWLCVAAESGNIKEPVFTFNKAITSAVTSADIKKSGSGYVVDLILSGKADQDIFSGRDNVSLGTLSVSSADDKAFLATVGIAGENGAAGEGTTPVVKYVNNSGTKAQTISLSDSAAVRVQGKETEKENSAPEVTETLPAAVKSFSVEYQNARKVRMTWKKAAGAQGYQICRSTKKNGKYTVVKTVKKGTAVKTSGISHRDGVVYYYKIRAYKTGARGETLFGSYSSPVRATVAAPRVTCKVENGRIIIKWSELSRADGYVIYRYYAKTDSYKKMAQVKGKKNTVYDCKISAGTLLDFRVRGYEKPKGRSRIYGKYSVVVQYKNALAIPGKVTAKPGRKQAVISWKKAGRADGYQIYRSTKKDGTFKRVETLPGNTKLKYKDEDLKAGKTYYYKVRAYRKEAGKKIFGKFSSTAAVKTK